MKINRTNYEAWFIDHFDGVLSADQEKELRIFLMLHPDLQKEFDAYAPVKLESDISVFDSKAVLKKQITASEEDHYFIGYTEQLLCPSDKLLVDSYVQDNPLKEKELKLYQKAKLGEEKISFPHKRSLYRKESQVFPLYYKIAIAATLLLLIGVVGILNYSGNSSRGLKLADMKWSFPNLTGKVVKKDQDLIPLPQKHYAYVPSVPKNVQSVEAVEPMLYLSQTTQPLKTDLKMNDPFFRLISYPEEGSMVNRNPDEDAIDPNFGQQVTSKLRDKFNKNTDEEPVKGRLRWWEVVNALGKGLSSLTGKPFKLDKTLDENGKLMAYKIDYGKYTIEKEMKP